MDGDALGDLRIAVAEDDLARIKPFDRLADVTSGEGHAQAAVTHAGPGGKGHFRLLKMQRGIRKQMPSARVIVMQKGDDHPVDMLGRNVQQGQCRDGIEADGSGAGLYLGGVIAGIEKDYLIAAPQRQIK